MKKFHVLLFLTLLVKAAFATTAPIAFYHAEGDGSDSTGSHPAGVQPGGQGGPNGPGSTNFATGKEGLAFNFTGTSNNVDLPDNSGWSKLQSFSFALWIKDNSTQQAPQSAGAPVMQMLDFFGSKEWIFTYAAGTQYEWSSGDSAGAIGIDLTPGQWNYLVVTRNGVSRKTTVYLNGQEQASYTGGSDLDYSFAGDIRIGSNFNLNKFWNGEIDELRVYDRALSAAEVTALATGTSGGGGNAARSIVVPPDLISWYRAAGDAYDSNSPPNNGTARGGLAYTTGEVGKAFSLNGTDAYVEVADNPNLNPQYQITLDGWFKTSTNNTTQYIVGKLNGSAANDSYALGLNGDKLRFTVSVVDWNDANNITVTALDVTPASSVADGKFHHLAGTYDGTTMTVYLDGVSVGTKSAPGHINGSASKLLIGARSISDAPTQFFNGAIDEVDVFRRCLRADEIKAIADAGIYGKVGARAMAFGPPANIVNANFKNLEGIGYADVNGDNKHDLLAANGGDSPSYFELLGDGTGGVSSTSEVSGPAAGTGFVIDDLNADGKWDVVTTHNGLIEIWLRNSTGGFDANRSYYVASSTSFTDVATADLDGDGFPDIVSVSPGYANSQGNVCLAVVAKAKLTNGVFDGYDSGVQYPTDLASDGGSIPAKVALGDVNGDGKLDVIVTVKGSKKVSVLLNQGNGVFGDGQSATIAKSFDTAHNPGRIVTGDFTLDGKADLAVWSADANGGAYVEIFKGNGDGTFSPLTTFALPNATVADEAAGDIALYDFDADGIPEIVATNASNLVRVFKLNYDYLQNQLAETHQNITVAAQPHRLAMADFNMDGKPDIIVAHANGGGISVIRNLSPSPNDLIAPDGFNVETLSPAMTGRNFHFYAHLGSPFESTVVKVQTSSNGQTWTDLPNGNMNLSGSATWTLDATNIPTGALYFRAVATAPNRPDAVETDTSTADLFIGFNGETRVRTNLPLIVAAAAPDLKLLVTAAGTDPTGRTATPGESLTYTLHSKNVGAASASSVSLFDKVPANTTLIATSLTASGGVLLKIPVGTMQWNLGTLPNDGIERVRAFAVNISTGSNLIGQSIVNPCGNPQAPTGGSSITSQQTGFRFGNTFLTRIQSPLLIGSTFQISGNGTSANPAPGDVIVYTLTITNNASYTATNAYVKFTAPNGTFIPFGSAPPVFLDANGSPTGAPLVRLPVTVPGGSIKTNPGLLPDNRTAVWYFGSLAPHAVKKVQVTVKVQYDLDQTDTVGAAGFSAFMNNPLSKITDPVTRLIIPVSASGAAVSFTLLPPPANLARPVIGLITKQEAAGFVFDETDKVDKATVTTAPFPVPGTGNVALKIPARNSNVIKFSLTYANFGNARAESLVVFTIIPKGTTLDTKSLLIDGALPPVGAVKITPAIPPTDPNADPQIISVQVPFLEPFNLATSTWAKTLQFSVVVKSVLPVGTDIDESAGFLTSTSLKYPAFATPFEMHARVVPPVNLSNSHVEVTSNASTFEHHILYFNTGGIASTGLVVRDTVPAGGKFKSAEFIDVNGSVLAPLGTIDKPAVDATTGVVRFHVGTVNPNSGGWVRVVFANDFSNLDTNPASVNRYQAVSGVQVYDASSVPSQASGGTTVVPGSSLLTQLAYSPALLGIGLDGNPLGRLFVGVIPPPSATPGTDITYTVFWGQLSDYHPNGTAADAIFPIPEGTVFKSCTQSAYGNVAYTPPGAISIYPNGFVYFPGSNNGHHADGATVTVTVAPNAQPGVIQSIGVVITSDFSISVYAPVTTTTIRPAGSSFDDVKFSSVGDAIGANISGLGTSKAPNATMIGEVNAMKETSTNIYIGGADNIHFKDGQMLITLGGGKVLLAGPSALVASGGGNLVASGGGNLVASGGGNLVAQGAGNVMSLPSENGRVSLTTANLSALMNGLVASGGGNYTPVPNAASLVASGGGNIVIGGGNNLVASGGGNLVASGGGNVVMGSSLINNESGFVMNGALLHPQAPGLVASGGGNLVASGGGNLVSHNPAGLIAQSSGAPIASLSPAGFAVTGAGSLVASGGGNIVASGGGNLAVANAQGLVATGGGNFISHKGSAIVASGGGNVVASGGGNLVATGGGN